MQNKLRNKRRRREVLAGLIIILASFTYTASLLLDFNFMSPYTTLEEDLSYLANNLTSLQISIWAWLATSAVTFLAIPPFLMLFHKRLRWLHYVNALLLLGASAGFLLMGLSGLQLHQDLTLGSLSVGLEQADEQTWIRLLSLYQDELLYRRIGSSFVGVFAVGLGITRFQLSRFPTLSTVLLMICGPTMIYYNWTDPEHLIRTVAMAGIMIGVVIFSVRVINKGLGEPF